MSGTPSKADRRAAHCIEKLQPVRAFLDAIVGQARSDGYASTAQSFLDDIDAVMAVLGGMPLPDEKED